jgi:hypothetical protein
VIRALRVAPALLLGALALGAAACSSAGGGSGDWSRSYLLPESAVFEALVAVLEEEGYLVEADLGAGRVQAEAGDALRGTLPVLVIEVRPRGERVLVDVQIRGLHRDAPTASRRTDSAVRELLHALDRRLQGGGEPGP